ncbi:hypothetical protein D3C72_2462580 [compost metagenome]
MLELGRELGVLQVGLGFLERLVVDGGVGVVFGLALELVFLVLERGVAQLHAGHAAEHFVLVLAVQ